MDKDDSVKMLAESIVKIENVKEEADENLESSDWNFADLNDADTLKSTIKKEEDDEDELEPPVTVFVEPEEVMEEEKVQEYEDPLSCSDNLSNAVLEKEERLSSPNTGGEHPTRTTSRKVPVGHTIEQSQGGDCRHFCEGVVSTPLLTNPLEKPSSEKCATDTSLILPTQNNVDDVLPFECNICQKKFPRKRSVIAHMWHHKRNNPYKCTIGQENFTGRISIVKHMQIHSGEGPHECTKCKRHFSLRSNVVRHMKTCQGLHYCPVCKKKFTERAEVVRHIASHTTENFHCCTVCQENFYERRQLMSHMLIAHSKSEHCPVCKVSIKDTQTLETHMRVHFRKKFYECSVCPENFKRKNSLVTHMLFHSEEIRHKCCICQKGFVRRQHLLHHLRTRVHMQAILMDTRQRCYICKETCRSRGHLLQHAHAHARKIHNKSLTNGVDTVGHTTSEPGENLCRSSVCQKNFSKNKDLMSHMQDQQPYHCSMCEMKFDDKATLTWHMHTHSGEELYECPICQKSFAARESFVMHMQVHMVERQFECAICEVCFSAKGDLLTHLQVHVGVRKNECAICQRSFSSFSGWHSHLQIHIREIQYECSVCQKGFADRRTLFEHVWKHVKEKKVCVQSARENSNIAVQSSTS